VREERHLGGGESKPSPDVECSALSFSLSLSLSPSLSSFSSHAVPANRCGTAAAWISVGAVHPSAAAASASCSQTPKAVNFLTAAAVSAALLVSLLDVVEMALAVTPNPPPLVMLG
jgi:hypothetical protein